MATDHREGSGVRSPDTAVDPPSSTDPDLVATLVRYEDGPDKCTIAPPDPDEADRLTTWLTANRDAFVALDERR